MWSGYRKRRCAMGPHAKIVIAFGTRPEAIKLAPLIRALNEEPWAATTTVAVEQQRDLLPQTLCDLHLVADYNIKLDRGDPSLTTLFAQIMQALPGVLTQEEPNLVIVQGDTTTALAVALSAFYGGYPVAHIEAGLRSGENQFPFPEEVNRKMISCLSTLHFAPTEIARKNLLQEAYDASRIFVSGNTVIDSLVKLPPRNDRTLAEARTVLITLHRRENWDRGVDCVCATVKDLLRRHPNIGFIWPLHPGIASKRVVDLLDDDRRVHIIAPMPYSDFIAALRRSYFTISDSGGVQEEAAAIGKPLLLLRTVTERPEAVLSGNVVLLGLDSRHLTTIASRLLEDDQFYTRHASCSSSFGDGRAAERIVSELRRFGPHYRFGNEVGDVETSFS
jgi:UDP-N-acetylglucosamine 2-epimerase (non-hydrolysing)